MYTGLLHLHSFLRYVVLILLIIAVVQAFMGWWGNNKSYNNSHDKINLFTLIGVHTQLVMGLILYFISPVVTSALQDMGAAMKDPNLRFWAVEHITMMLLSVILITVGRVRAKKAQDDVVKHKRYAIFFLLGLFFILISIPWPFSAVPRPWF